MNPASPHGSRALVSWGAPVALALALGACGGAKKVEFFDKPSSSTGDGGFSPNASPTDTLTPPPPDTPPDDPTPPEPGSPCTASKDCHPGFVCEVASCRGEGTCVDESSYGDQPRCACDGVTYAAGVSVKGAVRHVRECEKGEATACSARVECGGGAACNAPVKDILSCGSGEGTCWRWPPTCPDAPAAVRAGNTAPTFTAVCAAASNGRAYHPGGG